ncbi:MAG: phytanoyl-CoA dioxygenase family protein [Pseudomonadales bacterium]|nr:phytanoyl-CoA dioxygenase family protein [Pseudomonadales bacterium]
MNAPAPVLTDIEQAAFERDGYLVCQGLAPEDQIENMLAVATDHLAVNLAPVEYEVDVQYPGSPVSMDEPGGQTCRRLLHAYARDEAFRRWAAGPEIRGVLTALFRADDVVLSQCHHNCVMTKQPGFSSATLWHQDNRYWSFDQQNLISVWLAMGDETRQNGCLRVIPGTHRMQFEPGRFDAALFLRPDLPENKTLMAQARVVELHRGDVLFFHSRLFHAAGRNLSEETKFSLVFTYHEAANNPIEGTRSARFPGIPLEA